MKTDKLLSAYIMDPVINKKDKQGVETFFKLQFFQPCSQSVLMSYTDHKAK